MYVHMFTVSVTVWLSAMLFSVKWHNCQRFLLSCKVHWDRLFIIIMIIIIRRTCIQHKKIVCRTELSFISAPYTSQRCSEWSTGQHYCSWHPLLRLTFATMRRALLEQSIVNSMKILIDVGQNGAHSHNFFHHASVKLFGCLNTVTGMWGIFVDIGNVTLVNIATTLPANNTNQNESSV